MANECVVGVFESVAPAQLAVHILERAGFDPARMSLVTQHISPTSDLAHELNIGDDSIRDAVIGGTIGGLTGILSGAALYLVTGVGLVVVAGPMAAAVGTVLGAFLGAMEGWGVHRSQIKKYEQLVRDGKVLLVVDGDPETLAEADRMLCETEATEVHLHAKTSGDAAEIDDSPRPSERVTSTPAKE